MIFSVNIYADWNGYDWNTGNYVDIAEKKSDIFNFPKYF